VIGDLFQQQNMRVGVHPKALELRIIEILRPELPRSGDLHVEFNASVDAFSASGDFWLDADEFKNFAAALRALSASRSGTPTINSLSPKEMTLSLSMADPPDYVRVTFAFSKFRAYPPAPYDCSISVAFEAGLGSLAALIAWAENPTIDPPSQEDAGAL
jgi:hypothetical protein